MTNFSKIDKSIKPRRFHIEVDDLLKALYSGVDSTAEDARYAIDESITRLKSPEYKLRMERAGLTESELKEWVQTLIDNMNSTKIRTGKRPANVLKGVLGSYDAGNIIPLHKRDNLLIDDFKYKRGGSIKKHSHGKICYSLKTTKRLY